MRTREDIEHTQGERYDILGRVLFLQYVHSVMGIQRKEEEKYLYGDGEIE